MSNQPGQAEPSTSGRGALVVCWLGRVAGLLLAVGVYGLLSGSAAGITPEGRAAASISTLMAVWWMTQALPLAATSLLPLVLFPLAGVLPIRQAAAPYADPIIFLFMGGFMIARAIERWNLHRRIALITVLAVGTNPSGLIGGFMVATAFLSMWISNTATTVMMLPVGLSVIGLVTEPVRPRGAGAGRLEGEGTAGESATGLSHFAVCLLLGIAYAANIGGVGTLVGTPPNIVLAGFAKSTFDIEIGFGRWMAMGVPLVAAFLLITWLLLTRLLFPIRAREISGGREVIRRELRKLGRMSRGEWTVLAVFSMTAAAWVVREPLTSWPWLLQRAPLVGSINDTMIGLAGALTLFLIPVRARQGIFALDWQTAKGMPWGVLLLFGGGLSLAEAIRSSGLADWIGAQVHYIDWLPILALVATTTIIVIFLTEITSNTATATTFLPILGGIAAGLGVDPLLLLVPATLAASFAFMMPVATPPNAIVFGAGHISIGQMVNAGLWLNLIGSLVLPALIYTLGAWVLGIRV